MSKTQLELKSSILLSIVTCLGLAPLDMAMAKMTLPEHAAFSAMANFGDRFPASVGGRRLPRQNIHLANLSPLRHSKSNQLREWSGYSEKQTKDAIYNPELTRSLEAQYKSTVKPAEGLVESPYRFARPWEQQAYLEKNNEMAQWTAKEVANDQLKQVLNGADKDAAPVKIANNAKYLLGSEIGEDDKKNASNPSEPRKGLRPMRSQAAAPVEYYNGVQEEKIPTKLRYKMNVIRGRGEVKFTNPIVITSVNLDMQHQSQPGAIQTLDTSDKVSAQMSKNIKPLKLDSSVSYGVNRKVVSVNLSKKITDTITCDVTSQRFTNDYRDASGRDSAEQVKLGYAITF